MLMAEISILNLEGIIEGAYVRGICQVVLANQFELDMDSPDREKCRIV